MSELMNRQIKQKQKNDIFTLYKKNILCNIISN